MTFSDTRHPLQYVLDYKQTFGEWALKSMNVLFEYDTEEYYDTTSVIHFLMKRLNQSYDQIIMLELETRKKFFTIEKALYDKEVEKENN
jgi:hypothetical protein